MSDEQQIWTGSQGEVWLNNTDRLMKVQKFTFTQTNNYEDVDTTDSFTKQRRLVGCELTGEITQFKVNFAYNELMEKYKNGIQPYVTLVGKVRNPDTGEEKRISIADITLNGGDIFGFEKGKVTQDTIGFSAGNYEYL